jgi:TatD DNase family protein
MAWIDVHTHLNMLEAAPEDVLRVAVSAGVDRVITIGTCPDDLPVVLSLAEKFFPQVSCTLGIHPHEAMLYTPAVEDFIRAQAVRREVVAIGETGLDYYYNNAPREIQIQAFRAQMDLAEELALPVEIHTRDAESDTMQILAQYKGRVKGLLHCFTGSEALAEAGLACGFDISISGVVTFKNADGLRAVVKTVPLDRLHVETDAPFLSPVPLRGKKNQPAFMIHTAGMICELKGVSPEELQTVTRENAHRLFSKLQLT